MGHVRKKNCDPMKCASDSIKTIVFVSVFCGDIAEGFDVFEDFGEDGEMKR